MTVCYQTAKTGQIRTRENWLLEPAMNEQGIQFMLNSGIIKTVACPTNIEDEGGKVDGEVTFGRDISDFRLAENIPVPIDWILYIVLIKLLRDPKGLDVLKAIATKWLDTMARIGSSLAQASPGSLVSSWTHSHILAMMLEHSYMIRKLGARTLVDGSNWLTGVLAAAEVLGDVAGPASLVYSVATGADVETIKALAQPKRITKKKGK